MSYHQSSCATTTTRSAVRKQAAARNAGLNVQRLGLVPRSALRALLLTTITSSVVAQDVTTWHNNNARTGVQCEEKILTPANVAASFGKVFSLPVDGDVYAQPLYVSQQKMLDGQMHNVLVVATQRDFVYAFDAEGKNPAQGYLWRRSLLASGETWVSNNDVNTTARPTSALRGRPSSILRREQSSSLQSQRRVQQSLPSFSASTRSIWPMALKSSTDRPRSQQR